MLYKECACGCGKVFPALGKRKYNSRTCRNRAWKNRTSGITDETKAKCTTEGLSPKERWELMSLSEIDAECIRMHRSYGEVQSMYYNGNLPKNFGLKIENAK